LAMAMRRGGRRAEMSGGRSGIANSGGRMRWYPLAGRRGSGGPAVQTAGARVTRAGDARPTCRRRGWTGSLPSQGRLRRLVDQQYFLHGDTTRHGVMLRAPFRGLPGRSTAVAAAGATHTIAEASAPVISVVLVLSPRERTLRGGLLHRRPRRFAGAGQRADLSPASSVARPRRGCMPPSFGCRHCRCGASPSPRTGRTLPPSGRGGASEY
jgi:hypothetical protein